MKRLPISEEERQRVFYAVRTLHPNKSTLQMQRMVAKVLSRKQKRK